MMRIRSAPSITALALLAVWILAGATASARSAYSGTGIPGLPGLPTPPSIPNKKTLPGAKTVTFKVVVEGTAAAEGTRTVDGELGLCKAHLFEDVSEETSFGRGKGVVMEFIRYRQHGRTRYAIQRVGRNGDSSFAVVYKLERVAEGNTKFTPAFPPAPCSVPSEDVSKNPDCHKTFSGTADWGLKLNGTNFSLAPTSKTAGRTGGPISTCGKTSTFGGMENLHWQWPSTPAPLQFEPLPIQQLFGRRSAFKVDLSSGGGILNPLKQTIPVNLPTGSGTFEDTGWNDVTVRFIRVRNAR